MDGGSRTLARDRAVDDLRIPPFHLSQIKSSSQSDRLPFSQEFCLCFARRNKFLLRVEINRNFYILKSVVFRYLWEVLLTVELLLLPRLDTAGT